MKDRKMPSWQLPIAGFKSKFDNRQSVGFGEVSEWLIEPVSKTGVPFWGTAGSNPALSVIF
jgi:hypothetical protein